MSKKLEEDRDETAESVPEKKAKAKQGASAADASDLRALLLILVLTVIVFFILLYKQKHPEEYAKSVVQAKEGADAAYSKAGEILPEAYRGLDGFFKYVADYGKGSELPPELPKADIGALSSSVGSGTTSELSDETESGSGTEALSWSASVVDAGILNGAGTPLAIEFSGYRLEFDAPPSGPVTIELGGAKMTLRPSDNVRTDSE